VDFIKQKLEDIFGIDIRALVAFRISMGLLIICDLLVRAQDVVAHYSDFGVLPRNVLLEKFEIPWHFSFYYMSGAAYFQYLVMAVAIGFALCMAIGYRTRLMTFLSWIMLISIQNRNPEVLLGADVLFRMSLFWGIFLPLGATFSVDRYLSRIKRKGSKNVLSIATVALLVQIAFVYIVVALHKTSPEWTTEGSAVYYALMFDQFRTTIGGLFLQLGMPILKFITISTLALQLYGAFLLFSPVYSAFFRTVFALAFLGLQAGFGLCLHLGIFPWISMITLIPFLPTPFWDFLAKKFKIEIQSFENLAQRFYIWFCKAKNRAQNFLEKSPWPKRGVQFLVLLIFIDVININILSVKPGLFSTPWMFSIEQTLRLDQHWDMFSPKPPTDDGWFVLPGKLRDGTEVDVYRREIGVTFNKPEVVADMYPNNRWQKFMMNLWLKENEDKRLYYGQYLCRAWNDGVKDPQKQLATFEIYFVRSDNLLNYKKATPESVRIWSHRCF
jgi:hypothetical protein